MKKIGIAAICAMMLLSTGMVGKASYVSNISSKFELVGTSGSQWRTKATGKSTNTSGWLQAAIKLNSDAGWKWGKADTGNKQNLTAYSPGRVGAVSKMSKKTDHN